MMVALQREILVIRAEIFKMRALPLNVPVHVDTVEMSGEL
jgi:hypothetical protein